MSIKRDKVSCNKLIEAGVLKFVLSASYFCFSISEITYASMMYSVKDANKCRNSTGGRVCIYLDNKIPCKRLEFCNQDGVETIWIQMRPYSLPRQITSIFLGVIYNSTRNKQPENIILQEHIQKNVDALLSKQPNALVLITENFNPNSTGFQAKHIAQVNHL